MMTFPEALLAVADIASHWVGKTLRTTTRRLAVRRDDLEQAARIGAWKAWQSFRADLSSWRTWASKWIRAYVEREAWGSQAQRRSPKFEARMAMRSLDAVLWTRDSGVTMTRLDLLRSPAPSPERVAADRETLRRVRRALVLGEGGARATRLALAYASGVSATTLAEQEGVTLERVCQLVRPRMRRARAVWEAA